MTVVEQIPETRHEQKRWYASCLRAGCGVCGPIRSRLIDAMRDDEYHNRVCSERRSSAKPS